MRKRHPTPTLDTALNPDGTITPRMTRTLQRALSLMFASIQHDTRQALEQTGDTPANATLYEITALTRLIAALERTRDVLDAYAYATGAEPRDNDKAMNLSQTGHSNRRLKHATERDIAQRAIRDGGARYDAGGILMLAHPTPEGLLDVSVQTRGATDAPRP